MKTKLLIAALMALAAGNLAHGDTYFTNVTEGLITEVSNWDNGLPASTNVGFVGSAGSGTNVTYVEDLANDVITFTDSDLTRTTGSSAQNFNNCTLTFNGACDWETIGHDGKKDNFVVAKALGVSTINWNSSGSILNGGNFVCGGSTTNDLGFYNQSAGSAEFLKFTLKYTTIFTISGGTFSFSAAASITGDAYIDFLTTGTTGTITRTGADMVSDFQGYIDEGRVRIDGEVQEPGFYDKFLITYDGTDTSITLDPNYVPPAATAFTDGNANGLWSESGNWSEGVPTTELEASVNSNHVANLSGGSGNAKVLDVGTEDGQSGTVSNGSLTVVGATQVGVASNAVGVLSLTTFNSGTAADSMAIGVGESASGTVTAGSGTLLGNVLQVGSGVGGTGTLDMGAGTVDFSTIEVAKGGSAINGTLTTTNLTFGALSIGSSANSTGTVTAAAFTQPSAGNVSVGYGSYSLASFTGAGSLNAGVVAAGTGYASSGMIDVGSGSVGVATQLRLGIASYASGELVAGSVTIAPNKSILVAAAQNSTGTVSVSSITLPATNGVFIGTGDNSSHNITPAMLSITDPIGDFGYGQGSGSEIGGLINSYNTYGSLRVNAPLSITAKDHQITTLELNADLTVGGTSTGGLVDGGGVTIASQADRDISFDFADWVSGVVTSGPISVAGGENAQGTMVADQLVLDGTLQLGGNGSGSTAMVTVNTLDGEGKNSKQVKIAEGNGIGSTGTVAVVGNARIDDTWVGSAPEAVGTLTVGGSLALTNGILHIADGTDSEGTVGVTGAAIVKEIRVGEASGAVGTLDLAALTLTGNSGLKVGYAHNATGIATMDSLDGARYLDICNVGTNSTGTVTVDGNATIGQLRVGTQNDSTATLNVGGILDIQNTGTSYFNVGAGDRCLVEISATTINKVKTNNLSIAKSGAVDAYASIVATNGLLNAGDLLVANAAGAYGRLSIPGGTLGVNGDIEIATSTSSTGIVEIAINSFAINAVSIGTASNAIGTLTLMGAETLYASELNLGATNSGIFGEGSVTLAGGSLVVTGALDMAAGSYFDITSDASKLSLAGKTESDFEAMWATGALRSYGESGLTGAPFKGSFYVDGDTLAETPISFISIDNGAGGVDISWDSKLDQTYLVKTNINLQYGTWGTDWTGPGTGTNMTVTLPTPAGAVFYQVTAPIAP